MNLSIDGMRVSKFMTFTNRYLEWALRLLAKTERHDPSDAIIGQREQT